MINVMSAHSFAYQMIVILSAMIVVGLFMGRVFEKKKIPNLIAYILVGILGGVFLVFTHRQDVMSVMTILINIGMGFIAFSIGLELNFKAIKQRSKEIVIVTIFQALFAFLLTFIALYIFLLPLHIALVLGTLAIATEPGPILMITKRLRSKGPVTDTLVPLHGVEDIITIMLFGSALAYAAAVENNQAFGIIEMLQGPVLEILFSIAIAIAIGYILMRMIRHLKYEDSQKEVVILIASVISVLISVGIANQGLILLGHHIHLSPILLPMSVGIVFSNLSEDMVKHQTEHIVDLFSAPILLIFFTLLGAELVLLLAGDIKSIDLSKVVVISLIYVMMRTVGKLTGSYLGAKVAKSGENVRRYLGFCILPQAQAAIGLAFVAKSSLGNSPYGTTILIIIVIATFINAFVGPLGVRYGLTSSREADENFCTIVLGDEHHSH